MKITLNGKTVDIGHCHVSQLVKEDDMVAIVNGFTVHENIALNDGDSVILLDKNRTPTSDELDVFMCARDSPEVHEIMKSAKIGIAGLGGLGSNVASMLTRAGIGHLVIADMDTVDITNMNRQNYFLSDIGSPKTEATKNILHQISPQIKVTCHQTRVTPLNAANIFSGCSIVCEAFDDPEEKAMFMNTILCECPDTFVISGSGMAGYEDSNLIKTKRQFNNLCLCGDSVNEARMGMGLMAPRVGICAGHMANAVVRHLMGLDV